MGKRRMTAEELDRVCTCVRKETMPDGSIHHFNADGALLFIFRTPPPEGLLEKVRRDWSKAYHAR